MIALGISEHVGDEAAALVVNGRLVAAASEEHLDPPRSGIRARHGLVAAAADSCLKQIGISLEDVSTVAVANGYRALPSSGGHHRRPAHERAALRLGSGMIRRTGSGFSHVTVDSLDAHAAQVAGAAPADALVLILNSRTGGAAYLLRGGGLVPCAAIGGVTRLAAAARRVARALGCGPEDPQAMERLSAGGNPDSEAEFRRLLSWTPEGGITVDERGVCRMLRRIDDETPGSLNDSSSPNVHVQHRRQGLAASFHRTVAELAARIAERLREQTGAEAVGLGGDLFTSPSINSYLCSALGDGAFIAPVPEPSGLALGAALLAGRMPLTGSIEALRLGPSFTETEIKETLDNCRLDYVYEPDWERLLIRVSAMLARGKQIAWFQGPMDFGPRSLGSRSILADPSSRYARENLNCFLKHQPIDQPLALTINETAARLCFTEAVKSPYMLLQAKVKPEWRERLRAAVDANGMCLVHTLRPALSPELARLLEIHQTRSGIPALLNTTLSGSGESIARTPRDAVRTTFSSAVDALLCSRFLVSKDYWLLRSENN